MENGSPTSRTNPAAPKSTSVPAPGPAPPSPSPPAEAPTRDGAATARNSTSWPRIPCSWLLRSPHAGQRSSPVPPQPLFRSHIIPAFGRQQYDVSRDGRFLILTELEVPAEPIHILLNWKRP